MSRDLMRRIQRLEVVRAPHRRIVGISLSSRTEAEAAVEYAKKCRERGVTENDIVQVVRLSFDGVSPFMELSKTVLPCN